jgi:hypothetical protein
MNLLLTREELEELTGTRQPKRMTAWLTERGWVHDAGNGRSGTPKVDRTYYLARMSGTAHRPVRIGPRLDFMQQRSQHT